MASLRGGRSSGRTRDKPPGLITSLSSGGNLKPKTSVIKKLHQAASSREGSLDLNRPSTDYDSGYGYGSFYDPHGKIYTGSERSIPSLGGSKAARSLRDLGRSKSSLASSGSNLALGPGGRGLGGLGRGCSYHERSASGTSAISGFSAATGHTGSSVSGGVTPVGGSFRHPWAQTPRPYTPPGAPAGSSGERGGKVYRESMDEGEREVVGRRSLQLGTGLGLGLDGVDELYPSREDESFGRGSMDVSYGARPGVVRPDTGPRLSVKTTNGSVGGVYAGEAEVGVVGGVSNGYGNSAAVREIDRERTPISMLPPPLADRGLRGLRVHTGASGLGVAGSRTTPYSAGGAQEYFTGNHSGNVTPLDGSQTRSNRFSGSLNGRGGELAAEDISAGLGLATVTRNSYVTDAAQSTAPFSTQPTNTSANTTNFVHNHKINHRHSTSGSYVHSNNQPNLVHNRSHSNSSTHLHPNNSIHNIAGANGSATSNASTSLYNTTTSSNLNLPQLRDLNSSSTGRHISSTGLTLSIPNSKSTTTSPQPHSDTISPISPHTYFAPTGKQGSTDKMRISVDLSNLPARIRGNSQTYDRAPETVEEAREMWYAREAAKEAKIREKEEKKRAKKDEAERKKAEKRERGRSSTSGSFGRGRSGTNATRVSERYNPYSPTAPCRDEKDGRTRAGTGTTMMTGGTGGTRGSDGTAGMMSPERRRIEEPMFSPWTPGHSNSNSRDYAYGVGRYGDDPDRIDRLTTETPAFLDTGEPYTPREAGDPTLNPTLNQTLNPDIGPDGRGREASPKIREAKEKLLNVKSEAHSRWTSFLVWLKQRILKFKRNAKKMTKGKEKSGDGRGGRQ